MLTRGTRSDNDTFVNYTLVNPPALLMFPLVKTRPRANTDTSFRIKTDPCGAFSARCALGWLWAGSGLALGWRGVWRGSVWRGVARSSVARSGLVWLRAALCGCGHSARVRRLDGEGCSTCWHPGRNLVASPILGLFMSPLKWGQRGSAVPISAGT